MIRKETINLLMSSNQSILFSILHFNDVYDIQPNKKGKAGVVNFEAYLRKLKTKFPKHLLLFSGDAFSPSILSNIFQGKQMVTALNKLGIDVAEFGNHQFDYQPHITEKLVRSCNFPWLLGNIRYKDSQILLGNGRPYVIRECNGVKVGIFGVAGEDWLGILNDDYQNQLQYDDVGEYSKHICQVLKEQQKCEFIVALTHMRVPQDRKLPFDAPDVDIVLGGHDHIIMKEIINGIPVLKSGDNFKSIGTINIYSKNTNQKAEVKGRRFDFDIVVEEVPIAEEGIDQQLKQHVQNCMEKYSKSDHIVGYTAVPLDTRFVNVRTKQTNYGNFLADLARAYFDTDCSILNTGGIRMDMLIPAGQLRYSVISNIFNSLIVVKEVPGSVLLEALQYSCQGLPTSLSGKFLCVSGLKFSYNTTLKPMIQKVEVRGEPLNLKETYSVATQLYISTGGDGYQMLKKCKFIVDQVGGIDWLTLILKFFKGVKNITQCSEENKASENKINSQEDADTFPLQMLKLFRKLSSKMSRMSTLKKKFVVDANGQKNVCIFPTVQGRIICLNQ